MRGITRPVPAREQCLFLCFGEGANGKSTFLETLRYVVGSYAHNLPFSALELTARSGISNDIAGLVSQRHVTAAELCENMTLNEGRVKALTGGDVTTARRLYNDFFSFTPTMKFWLAVNHKPRVTDDTHGFWRRIRLIPFLAKFDRVEQGKNLGAKLRAEATGILAWAFQGCRLWQDEGLGVPIAVQNATAAYQAESDWLTAFLQDQYELCPDGTVTCAQLNSDLKKWAAENGEIPPNARALASRLRKRGLNDARLSHGRTRAWRGMKPKVKCLPNLNADARTDVDTRIQ